MLIFEAVDLFLFRVQCLKVEGSNFYWDRFRCSHIFESIRVYSPRYGGDLMSNPMFLITTDPISDPRV